MHRRGRPPLDEHDVSVSVSVRLTTRDYDRIYQQARQERLSVPEHIRRTLKAARAAEKDRE